jgi:LuxR family maltose regulon positive regulatory protein
MNRAQPVALPANGVLRPCLLNLLSRSQSYALTLLLAPAGSGKSTLLQHWRAETEDAVVYVPLQGRDNEPMLFFRRLTDRIREQVGAFDSAWFNPLAVESNLSSHVLVELLLDALSRVDGTLYVVLDDFQWINAPSILEVMAALIEQLPAHVHLIIASRNHPGFSLSRLKLENRLLSIDQHDLRLSAEQVRLLNSDLGGQQLSQEYIDALLNMTEGWVAGVKIALLAYVRSGARALEKFDGSQPEIVDYFGHVVLRQLPDDLREFLLCSALLERFDGTLCDFVMQRKGSARLLEELAERQLFLLPMENQPGWFRFHALLQDFLCRRLWVEQYGQLDQLNRRAADYYLSLGEFEQALLHARRCTDQAVFLELLELSCANWVRSGRFGDILRWLEPLSDEVLGRHPRLLTWLVAALSLSRRFHQAHYYLELLENSVVAPVEPATLRFLGLLLGLFEHDKDFITPPEWMQTLGRGQSLEIRACTLAALSYQHLLASRLQDAIRCASESKQMLGQCGYSFLESYTDLIIALCHRNAGRATHARKEVCNDFWRTSTSIPAWVNRATAMVVALYEQNRLDEAHQLCEQLMAVINSSSATEAIATVYITLSRLFHHRDQAVRASRLLDQLSCILQLGNYSRFVSQVAQEGLCQAFLSGKPALLEVLAQRYELPARLQQGEWESVRSYDESWERSGLACVYWLRSRGAQGQAQAERILKVLASSLRCSEMRARLLVVEANQLVLAAPGLLQEQQLVALLRLMESHGVTNLSRSVFDEAPGFGAMVQNLARAGVLVVPPRYREHYAEFFEAEQGAVVLNPVACGLLTGKEVEVFECLLNGLSNTQISDKTGIALSTTKWHLKNIYSKLNVSSRTEAILSVRPRTSFS